MPKVKSKWINYIVFFMISISFVLILFSMAGIIKISKYKEKYNYINGDINSYFQVALSPEVKLVIDKKDHAWIAWTESIRGNERDSQFCLFAGDDLLEGYGVVSFLNDGGKWSFSGSTVSDVQDFLFYEKKGEDDKAWIIEYHDDVLIFNETEIFKNKKY